jgi:hypothetical protein
MQPVLIISCVHHLSLGVQQFVILGNTVKLHLKKNKNEPDAGGSHL